VQKISRGKQQLKKPQYAGAWVDLHNKNIAKKSMLAK
jgi:hypothetical protein